VYVQSPSRIVIVVGLRIIDFLFGSILIFILCQPVMYTEDFTEDPRPRF